LAARYWLVSGRFPFRFNLSNFIGNLGDLIMPYYDNAPPERAILIEQGWPVYLFGTRQSIDSENYVTSVAITGNVATVGVSNLSGPLPVVGGFASIKTSQTNSGLFNVVNAPITAVSLDPTGTGTVSFALTNADIATMPDVGKLYVRFAALGEAVTSAGGSSIAGSVGNVVGRNGNWLTAQVSVQGPSAVTVALQGSNTNNDADFQTIANITLTNGVGSTSVESSFEFVRFNLSAVTGTGTAVCSINA
jgi:hypothetical protein